MWSTPSRPINYNLAPEMGMVGLRDLFVVAPASSFNHNQHEPIISDPHSINGSNPATALGVGVGVGVIPLLTATPCLAPANTGIEDDQNNLMSRRRSDGIHLWQPQQSHYFKKQVIGFDHHNQNNNSSGNLVQSSGLGPSSSSGTTTCQDCGNQAKKDCSHRRCRTCCKSRGLDCATHVKSTWVPAARRRERQLVSASAGPAAGSSGSTSGAKKPRLLVSQTTTSHTSTSNTTPPRSFDTTSSQQDVSFKGSLPSQVRALAVFKCVRVTAVDDGDDEFAYQAVVKIGGRIFKGFLYDQGAEPRDGSTFPNISDLHLSGGMSGDGGAGGGRNGGSSSSPILDPSHDVYAGSGGGGLLGGSNYGNPIN